MKPKIILLVCLFAFMGAFLYEVNNSASSQEYSIQVAFIDVGQGDAALIQNSDGYDILIDGGTVSAGPTVLNYLREHGVFTLNAMIASHADSDHIGGLISILNATDITVSSVFYNGYPGDTQIWSNFVTAVHNDGLTLTTMQFPEELHWGSTSVYVLNPISGLINPKTNDASIVLLLDQSEVEFLFTGDIDSSVESQILARGTPVAVDVLKVAHHGSNYSSSDTFLSAVMPSDSIISVGENPYGHPGEYTLARLLAIGSNVWRTDRNGTILVISSDGIYYQVIPTHNIVYFFLPIINK